MSSTNKLRFAAAGLLACAITSPLLALTPLDPPGRGPGLAAVGPVNPANGFPTWYEDTTGLTLELCLNTDDELCLLDPVLDLPNGAGPVSFPDNFPVEAFWWTGDASMTTTAGGDADLIMALEAAFLNEQVIDGEQVAFARVRIRIDNLVDGETYTIYTPYGVFQEVAVGNGPRGINQTEDVGLIVGDYTVPLTGLIGPFLVPEPFAPVIGPVSGAEYIADPGVLTAVSGSPVTDPVTGQPINYFRVVGFRAGVQQPSRCTAAVAAQYGVPRRDCITTDQFTLSGKIATNFGVTAERTSYSRNANSGNGRINIFARSKPGELIDAAIPGRSIQLLEDPAGSGKYYGRMATTPFAPAPIPADGLITLTNTSDVPPTVVTSVLRDAVVINTVTWAVAARGSTSGTLTVNANTTDNGSPVAGVAEPILTVTDQDGNVIGTVLDQTATDFLLDFPPSSVTVTSSFGGSQTRETLVVGPIVP